MLPEVTRNTSPGNALKGLIMKRLITGACLAGLWLSTLQPALAQKEPSNTRTPENDAEWKYWLDNMVRLHGFSDGEIAKATGETAETIAKLRGQYGIRKEDFPKKRDNLLVVPWPGGRHPRIGFLEGAIRPQRETKVSVFTPWAEHDYVVVDVPEALWSNLGLTYLAHTHIPTYFDKQELRLKKLEWVRKEDGSFTIERKLPNGIVYTAKVEPKQDHVAMELTLKNGTKELLTDLRVQNCVMLKSAAGFNSQTNDNKIKREPFAVCRAESGDRWIITAWEPLHRVWFNERCPCLHSDPKFPDCPAGKTVKLRGWLSFYEGKDIDAEVERLTASWLEN